ncbi:hypothetical protein EDC14_10176 [Hydrogenispora ethanolica]|uniref:Uncharacterized protein n=1 Tax=Hydrogenispora ethanolica TaxID=1082276 RepID=A0A4R1RGS7_HYDET|nr:hypothetical protein EDC14_10176 [Hydrogenispora ethanolica]
MVKLYTSAPLWEKMERKVSKIRQVALHLVPDLGRLRDAD